MNQDLLALLDDCRSRCVTLTLEDGQLRARGVQHHRRRAVGDLGGIVSSG